MKYQMGRKLLRVLLSPPTRAEWIEIVSNLFVVPVATGLRPHGRSGLKWSRSRRLRRRATSPPTRAEWIEMEQKPPIAPKGYVSAHTGGVD